MCGRKNRGHLQMQRKRGDKRWLDNRRIKAPKMQFKGNPPGHVRTLGELYFHALFGELEVLTEELVSDLLSMGWDERVLRNAQAMGLYYSRQRNSFTEGVLSWDGD